MRKLTHGGKKKKSLTDEAQDEATALMDGAVKWIHDWLPNVQFHWAAFVGAAIFAALFYIWIRYGAKRIWTVISMIVAAATVIVPIVMGRAMFIGPISFGGWWTGGLISAGLLLCFFLPQVIDNLVAGIGFVGGLAWAAFVIYMLAKGADPPQCTAFVATACCWVNVALDLEETEAIKNHPGTAKWPLLVVGFVALALI